MQTSRSLFAAGFALVVTTTAMAASPYVGQERRAIKAYSETEVADYLKGAGMGLAKAAELNQYPGPSHVLELADELALTAEQRTQTQRNHDTMRARAVELGRMIVEKERELDHAFMSRTISPEVLRDLLDDIGRAQTELRYVHLRAHLEQVRILKPEQRARYDAVRGYQTSGAHGGHEHRP